MEDKLPDDHILTSEDIEWLIKQGACEYAWKYEGETVAAALADEPVWALKYAQARMTDAQFDRAAEAKPWAALKYAQARLTDAQLERAADAAPRTALEFAQARMTDAQFERAADAAPRTALLVAPERYAKMMERRT